MSNITTLKRTSWSDADLPAAATTTSPVGPFIFPAVAHNAVGASGGGAVPSEEWIADIAMTILAITLPVKCEFCL